MKLEVKFSETNQSFKTQFSEICNISDGGYEKGYAEGYEVGNTDGYNKGLAARTYETWTITLTDGSVIEKEVVLL